VYVVYITVEVYFVVCTHMLCWKYNYTCMHLNLSDWKVNFSAVDIHCAWFLWRFSDMFSRFMKPDGSSSLITFSAAFCYLCRIWIFIKHNMMVQMIFPFGNQEYLPITVHILIRKFITPWLSVRSQFLVRFYSWWNVQSWTSVISLNTYISNICAVTPGVSYFVYRGSLQTTCDIWSRIRLNRGFYLMYIPMKYIFIE
jgi:hypothetical protein